MTSQPGRTPTLVAPPSVYRDAVIVFTTLHGKHRQVAPAFAETLRAQVIATATVDTDQFGTFTGDIARALAPVEAARAKARLGMEALGLPYGLASEASYGPLPGIGISGHEEILLFLNDTRGLEIIEGNRTLTIPGTRCHVRDAAELEPALARWGFPGQGLIVRPAAGGSPSDITKGIISKGQLHTAVQNAARRSYDGRALVEPDLRAHHNPTRRAVLTQLGHNMAQRLNTGCPSCTSPGYGRTGTQPGLPCSVCRTPTELTCADTYTCTACSHSDVRPRAETAADPRWCPACNP